MAARSERKSAGQTATRARGWLFLCLAFAGVATVSGCQIEDNAGDLGGERTHTASATSAAPASFTVSVPDRATDVRPDAAITVAVHNGALHTVAVTDPKGNVLRGTTAHGAWKLTDMMTPGVTYTLVATAQDNAGQTAKQTQTFTTIVPRIEATYRVTPDKETVGVGMPVMVTFDSSVKTSAQRAAVQKRMKLDVSPAQTGSWGWLSDNQLMWRPKGYWKPNTKVSVAAPLRGLQTGDGKFITVDKSAVFTISPRSRISTVDLARHIMTVRENGKVVHTYPISAGQATDKYETRSGTKVITEKRAFMVMDAATLGVPKDDPNYYRTEVDWAMRVTNTGEFLHSAPWSTWAQGRRNVSHGCVNMGPRDAKAMFADSIVGDVVDFTGSGRRMKPQDGLSVWLFSYADWQKKSAVMPAPSATDSGASSSRPTKTSTPATSTPPSSATPTPTSN